MLRLQKVPENILHVQGKKRNVKNFKQNFKSPKYSKSTYVTYSQIAMRGAHCWRHLDGLV